MTAEVCRGRMQRTGSAGKLSLQSWRMVKDTSPFWEPVEINALQETECSAFSSRKKERQCRKKGKATRPKFSCF